MNTEQVENPDLSEEYRSKQYSETKHLSLCFPSSLIIPCSLFDIQFTSFRVSLTAIPYTPVPYIITNQQKES